MYCSKCGKKIKDYAKFCPYCGENILTEEEESIQGGLGKAILDFQSGNSDAFAIIYEESKKHIYYVVCRCTSNKNIIEDLMQEIFVDIYNHLVQLQDINAYFGWIRKIAINRVNSHFRKMNLEEYVEDFEQIAESQPEDSEIMLPEESAMGEEFRRLVNLALDSLKPIQKLCIQSYYYYQMSVAEIASSCDIPEGTVKAHLSRGRDKLKSAILDIEKKQGVCLHSAAIVPFLFMFFAKEAKACEVPAEVSAKVISSVRMAVVGATASVTSNLVGVNGVSGIGTLTSGSVATTGAMAGTGVNSALGTASTSSVVGAVGMASVPGAAVSTGITLGTKIAIAAMAGTVIVGGSAVGYGAYAVYQNKQQQVEQYSKYIEEAYDEDSTDASHPIYDDEKNDNQMDETDEQDSKGTLFDEEDSSDEDLESSDETDNIDDETDSEDKMSDKEHIEDENSDEEKEENELVETEVEESIQNGMYYSVQSEATTGDAYNPTFRRAHLDKKGGTLTIDGEIASDGGENYHKLDNKALTLAKNCRVYNLMEGEEIDEYIENPVSESEFNNAFDSGKGTEGFGFAFSLKNGQVTEIRCFGE